MVVGRSPGCLCLPLGPGSPGGPSRMVVGRSHSSWCLPLGPGGPGGPSRMAVGRSPVVEERIPRSPFGPSKVQTISITILSTLH